VIAGLESGAVTVSVAVELVTLPNEFVTVTENLSPLSLDVVAGVVYDAEFVPTFVVPFCH